MTGNGIGQIHNGFYNTEDKLPPNIETVANLGSTASGPEGHRENTQKDGSSEKFKPWWKTRPDWIVDIKDPLVGDEGSVDGQ